MTSECPTVREYQEIPRFRSLGPFSADFQLKKTGEVVKMAKNQVFTEAAQDIFMTIVLYKMKIMVQKSDFKAQYPYCTPPYYDP